MTEPTKKEIAKTLFSILKAQKQEPTDTWQPILLAIVFWLCGVASIGLMAFIINQLNKL
jgi:hypothetical protein